MRPPRAAVLALAAALPLAACGERVRVVDAATGAAVPGAVVRATDDTGAERDRARTGGDGDARVAIDGAAMLWVSADGYRTWGARAPAGGPVTVSLQPAWIGAFIEPATSVHEPRKPCPTCPRRGR